MDYSNIKQGKFCLFLCPVGGGGLLVSVFMLPMRDPRTEAQVQGYLYTFWETIRISAIKDDIAVVGAAVSIIFLNSLPLYGV